MSNSTITATETSYRALYGKLFAALLHQFGSSYISEIEDAIQNSFLKSLKTWKLNHMPTNKENWLFIVARNDVLNQLKKQKNSLIPAVAIEEDEPTDTHPVDLRLQTILLLATLESITAQAKILFILKNIFGLSIAEISSSTLLNTDAIYKNINRTKKNIQHELQGRTLDLDTFKPTTSGIAIAEEVFYAVFNIGFDSFNEKIATVVNADLCLEAFALTRLLFNQYGTISTSHLLALFSFHIARTPAKMENGKLISFFQQDRTKWSTEMLQWGFHYLKKTDSLNKYYLEAVIISKYIFIAQMAEKDWLDMVKLYDILYQVSPSPIVQLNYCYCLSRIHKSDEALAILDQLEKSLPADHLYFTLVKAKIIKDINPQESQYLFSTAMHRMNQQIRKEYLLENILL